MAQNPAVQDKLYQELSSVLHGGDYDEKLSSQLPYMKQCFKESTRISPIIPANPKRLRADITLKSGHVAPAGMDVYVGLPALNRDPEFFEEPEKLLLSVGPMKPRQRESKREIRSLTTP